MTTRLLRTLLAALPLCTLALLPGREAAAQQPWPGTQTPAIGAEDELSPRQMQAPPAVQPGPRRPRPAQAAPAARVPAASGAIAPTARAQATRGAPTSIVCNGVFGKDSTHLKLAMAFEARNITFTEVDGPDGSKLNASVVYPHDPKRRLEVLWNNDAARSGTSLIVIGGQSQWAAPKGLKIGMAIAALEKANGKPFKLSGLDQPNGGSVVDWDGGALDSLPGGCKVGVRLAPDPKAPETARGGAGGKEFLSNNAALKPAKLGIAEIILGY